jgi:hypothetical protein
MLRALGRLLDLTRQGLQLALELDTKPRNAAELKARLVELGLDPRYECTLTSNRSVVVSFSDRVLRVHRGYLGAPRHVHAAIVSFVGPAPRRIRLVARRELLAYRLDHSSVLPTRRDRQRTHDDDVTMAAKLHDYHRQYNAEKFGGELSDLPIHISRRMRTKLGHYTHRDREGRGAEIVISRRHIRRHGWNEALQTLLHEMVHQWQDESGMPIDHGRGFRAKAKAIGITPLARRDVA